MAHSLAHDLRTPPFSLTPHRRIYLLFGHLQSLHLELDTLNSEPVLTDMLHTLAFFSRSLRSLSSSGSTSVIQCFTPMNSTQYLQHDHHSQSSLNLIYTIFTHCLPPRSPLPQRVTSAAPY